MKFILTIDTEADNQWKPGIDITTQNLRFIPRLQNLCVQYNIRPTFLVTSEVCADNFAKELLGGFREAQQAEIGAHLHIWTTPPFEDKNGLRYNDHHHGFANELTESLLRDKIERLTREVAETFGQSPTAFRSGRYGFDNTCARILLDNGYSVDSSVTPYIDWSSERGVPGGTGGPDFTDKGAQHYWISAGDRRLLEIPVTILPTIFPFRVSDALTRMYSSLGNTLLARGTRKLSFGTQPVWLRPYRTTTSATLKKIVGEARKRDLEFLTMMFHSSELMPGCSPYTTDEREVEALYALLEEFFSLLHQDAVPSVTLSEAARSIPG
jgi:hypothetical protein